MKLAEGSGGATMKMETAENALAVIHAMPEGSGAAIAAASPHAADRWSAYSGLTLEALVMVPLQDMALRELMLLRPGAMLRSQWSATSDVLLYINEVLLGLVSLEPTESCLGFRLNSLMEKQAKKAPIDRDTSAAKGCPAGAVGLDAMEVPVFLCFGTKRIDLGEILGTTIGDLVALDRGLEEQVTVLVDRKVFAAGTLVLINGCYGVEVTHVVTPGIAPNSSRAASVHAGISGAQVVKAADLPSCF